MNLSFIIPFYEGHLYIERLLDTLPADIPVILVDDQSPTPYTGPYRSNVTVIRPPTRGYFSGAVNAGIEACHTDVVILNQDLWFEGNDWLNQLVELTKQENVGTVGDGVFGHPAWPNGYVQGTFMYISRVAWESVGPFNTTDYPLWGATAEWQARACRKGFTAHPLPKLNWFKHRNENRGNGITPPLPGEGKYGAAINKALAETPERRDWFIRTPPAISVIIPCYNYGRFLQDCINSLIGGTTCLGEMPGQTLQSFEAIIVDDSSTDGETSEIGQSLADSWSAVRYLRTPQNLGTAGANNYGIRHSYGRYITILSADDMRRPMSLERMYRAIQANPGSVVYDNMYTFRDGQYLHELKMKGYDFDQLLERNMMHAGILFEKKAWQEVGGYPAEMRYGREDWAFNIRLGIAGYCGLHIDYDGYLYRRGDANRSLRNKGDIWRQQFMMQLYGLYPEIYKGERPMACCGNRGAPSTLMRSKNGGGSTMMLGTEGMTMLEYTGQNYGTTSFYGPVTKTRYSFGLTRNRGFVDNRDLRTGSHKNPGLLELYEGGRKLFKEIEPPAEEPQPAPEPEPMLEIQAEAPSQIIELEPAVDEFVADEPVVDEPLVIEPDYVETPTTRSEFELDPINLTVQEAIAIIDTGELSSQQLEEMLHAETTGKNRVTLVTYLREKIANG